jgi:Putative Flp pilus-assembly TadE/G-like
LLAGLVALAGIRSQEGTRQSPEEKANEHELCKKTGRFRPRRRCRCADRADRFFLALAVDVGVLYSARTSAQEVADAAALAGAFTFINNTKSPQPQTASDNARQVALNNSILGQPIAAAGVNVNVDAANRRVTVDVQSTQNTYFARALGLQTADVAVEAVAEASKYSTGSSCAHSGERCGRPAN